MSVGFACNANPSYIFMTGVHICHNDCLLCVNDLFLIFGSKLKVEIFNTSKVIIF